MLMTMTLHKMGVICGTYMAGHKLRLFDTRLEQAEHRETQRRREDSASAGFPRRRFLTRSREVE
jgi:hypothetical protein